MDKDNNSVKVAVRVRPLNDYEAVQDSAFCINVVPGEAQIQAGGESLFTFDHTFGEDCTQEYIYNECVDDLLHAAFEGFNATILAYGQTGSGKTYTMGSAAEEVIAEESLGIIPRVIKNLFQMIQQKEEENSRYTFKVYVQFLEIYGEDIKDLLDQTKTSKVTIREMRSGEVFVTGAKEELVSSYEQMLKALEDGTKNRTTASTKMNQTSSRSHAIFTVNLEHIIHGEVINNDNDLSTAVAGGSASGGAPAKESVVQHEVRRSKFSFVDLAGSERAKRTGAQGQQLREGIDINKGLLSLGNVISALGDDSKRGKVFVPYRDSKLTRMLQDSLGGNSKTLMICCVSPASINYHESLNALRYANRARNIKNKPVVNRDPTMVMIEQLRASLTLIAGELLDVKRCKQYVESPSSVTVELLESIVAGNSIGQSLSSAAPANGANWAGTATQSGRSAEAVRPSSTNNSAKASADLKKLKVANEKLENDYFDLKSRLQDLEFELQRQTEQLKVSRQNASQLMDQLHLAHNERDFFRIKWSDACPIEAAVLEKYSAQAQESSLQSDCTAEDLPDIIKEKAAFVRFTAKLQSEIDSLQRQLCAQQTSMRNNTATGGAEDKNGHSSAPVPFPAEELDADFTSAISSLIAQTKSQLLEESRKLAEASSLASPVPPASLASASADEESSLMLLFPPETAEDREKESQRREEAAINEDKAFNKRQRLLQTEVEELGQSILLKEQLMLQLIKSQQQYGTMKAFYEQRLTQLAEEMRGKEEEREKLVAELSDIAEKAQLGQQTAARELKLREDLQRKDDEIFKMRRKHDELRSLSQVQSQYTRQMAKLEEDIQSMKKQRVDLTKTLQSEKKSYMMRLAEKAKEIDKLKKELQRVSSEAKKLGRSKELAELKAKDAIREGAVLKKRTQELLKQTQSAIQSPSTSAVAALALQDGVSMTSTRNAIKAMSKAFPRRYLSEEELKVKKWIDSRIAEIAAREKAAESLKKQYEHQLELLQRKEAIEFERSAAMTKVASQQSAGQSLPSPRPAASLPPPPPQQKLYGTPWSNTGSPVRSASPAPEPPEAQQNVVLSSEEEKLLETFEERLSSINGQLSARTQRISDMTRQMISDESQRSDISHSSDKAVEVLKRTAAGSLPAAHELIRMLFDMLILASKNIQLQDEQLVECQDRERGLVHRYEELQQRSAAEKRALDLEFTQLNRDYEHKLHGFLHHITSSGDSAEQSPLRTADVSSASKVREMATKYEKGLSASVDQSIASHRQGSLHAKEIQLAVLSEESELLRSQLARERTRSVHWESKSEELENIKSSLMSDIEEKNFQIKFLEEDRELFKRMAEELKAALHGMGRDGKELIANVADRVGRNRLPGLFSQYNHPSDGLGHAQSANSSGNGHLGNPSASMDEDDGDESMSILGEFDNLVDEIQRTGVVSSAPLGTHGASRGADNSDIFHRLNDPSNYTGHMRKIFKDDLAGRRRRIQEIRAHDNVPKKPPVPTQTSSTSQPWTINEGKMGNFNRKEVSFSVQPEDRSDLLIDTSDVDSGETPHSTFSNSSASAASLASPDPASVVPNVFSRLTKSMTGIHKRRDGAAYTAGNSSAVMGFYSSNGGASMLPRTSSPSTQRTAPDHASLTRHASLRLQSGIASNMSHSKEI